MAKALDIAEYILKTYGAMSVWKLQKLVYYSQAWHLVWNDTPLFEERIEAWANGPVVKALYLRHRGEFTVLSVDGDATAITDAEKVTAASIYKHYGPQTAAYLSQLTHLEQPWIIAREGVPDGVRSKLSLIHI